MPDYAAIALVSPVSGKWELMSVKGRVVVFDTAQMAWEWLPMLGQGRICRADERALSVTFLEVSATLPNRARVVCPYAPGEAMPWKHHVIWTELGITENREGAGKEGSRESDCVYV
jgi:hypothetical protein